MTAKGFDYEKTSYVIIGNACDSLRYCIWGESLF